LKPHRYPLKKALLLCPFYRQENKLREEKHCSGGFQEGLGQWHVDVFASPLTPLPLTCRKEENPGVGLFTSNLLFPKR